jgi:hypothetical protein
MIKEAKKLIEDKIKVINDSPDDAFKLAKKAEKSVLNEILSEINRLEIKDGSILMNRKNLLILEDITEDLKKISDNEAYLKVVKELVGGIDSVKELNDKYFKTVFDAKPDDFAKKVLDNSRKYAVEAMIGASMHEQFLKPISDLINTSIQSGASINDLTKNIREFVEGNNEVDGRLSSYSRQVALDSISISDRAYTNAIVEELDFEFYFYAGGIVEPEGYTKSGNPIGGTRCFCRVRDGEYYHWKEIEAWGNGDTGLSVDEDCGYPWHGMRDGTNGATIFTFLGGYNCQHSLMPVSVFDVPKDVIERAMDLDFYKPSKKELELLDL